MADGVDERDESIGLLDDGRAVGLPGRVPGVDGLAVAEAVDRVGEVRREPPFDLVGLDVEVAPRAAVAVVGLAGDETSN